MYSHYLTPMGRFEESVAEARRALALDPLDVLLNVHLSWAYLHARRYDEAITQGLKAIAMDPTLEVAYTAPARQATAYDLAVLYVGLNDTEQAFDWLQKAYMERSGGLLQIKADVIFDPIRSDERFKSLLRSLGLPPS